MGRYNNAAKSAHKPEEAQEERDPHTCSAYGCPLAGSIIIDGRARCFVHLAIPEIRNWDSATQRIRARMPFVQAIEILRSQGTRTDAMALSDARDLVPALDPKHDTRYKALVALETRLTTIAKLGELAAQEDEPDVPLNPVLAAAAQFIDSHRVQP